MPALLQQWLTRQAQRAPDAVALVFNQERMTYGQLEQASNRLARLLQSAGCRKGDRVCVLVPKSPAAITAFLGILKADCIYVPVDTASPATRVAKVLDSCENRWVLAADRVSPLLDELFLEERFRRKISVGWLGPDRIEGAQFKTEFCWGDLASYSSDAVVGMCVSSDPAHILFTSGSTGTPKGVIITHSNVIHFVEWASNYFGMTSSDRVSGHSPLHFDLSTFDIYGALSVGAELHLVPPELNLFPNKLVDFIRSADLTQWFSVPSVLNYAAKFDAVKFNDFPTLKRILWCGEKFPTPPLMYWMERLPHVSFTNLYGPTEATIASSYFRVPECPRDEKAEIPIGTGCEGEELLVLDERMQPLPPSEIGDLYIRGVGLSPGYWRDPDKTREAFRPNPHSSDPSDRLYKTGDLAKVGTDGLVYFVGRADSQIKSRGYRIELGEIETALNALGCLQECAVVAFQSDNFEGATICCAYVPLPDAEPTSAALSKKLSKFVPSYMLPSRWMRLERLPKNANGKIDRPKLRQGFQQSEARKTAPKSSSGTGAEKALERKVSPGGRAERLAGSSVVAR